MPGNQSSREVCGRADFKFEFVVFCSSHVSPDVGTHRETRPLGRRALLCSFFLGGMGHPKSVKSV